MWIHQYSILEVKNKKDENEVVFEFALNVLKISAFAMQSNSIQNLKDNDIPFW